MHLHQYLVVGVYGERTQPITFYGLLKVSDLIYRIVYEVLVTVYVTNLHRTHFVYFSLQFTRKKCPVDLNYFTLTKKLLRGMPKI